MNLHIVLKEDLHKIVWGDFGRELRNFPVYTGEGRKAHTFYPHPKGSLRDS